MLVALPGLDHMLRKVGKSRYAAFNGAGPGTPGSRPTCPAALRSGLSRLSSSRPARLPGTLRNEPEIALRDPCSLAVCGRNPRRNSAPVCQCVTPIPKPSSRISPPPAGRTGSGLSRRQNAMDPGFHGVPSWVRHTRSGHAELVALGVAQHDRMPPHVFIHPGDAGSRLHELFYLLRHQLLAFLALHLAVGHPDVEVDTVLDGLPLGHALEKHPGPLVGRVDDGRLVTELFLRHPDGPAEILPGLEAVRRRLEHVIQRQ